MEQVVLWGTGKTANIIMDHCLTLDCYCILGFIDNDCSKIGKQFRNYMVYSINILEQINPDRIIILSDYYKEIREQIIASYPLLKNKIEDKYYFFKNSLINRYRKSSDPEINKVIRYIENNGLDIFNYSFKNKYVDIDINVYYDQKEEMFFVLHLGKKMYFPKRYKNQQEIISYYRTVLIEQDMESPHRYLSDNCEVFNGDIVVDAGVAEGFFSLEIIDRVKKIYLIEADEGWIEALKATFRNYMNKVELIKGYLTSYDEGNLISLDNVIHEPVNFIKMDIEGAEYDALCGAERIINKSDNLRMSICSYHSDYDQVLIEKYMDNHKILHCTSNGYMWYPYLVKQNMISTKLNKAVVRGYK